MREVVDSPMLNYTSQITSNWAGNDKKQTLTVGELWPKSKLESSEFRRELQYFLYEFLVGFSCEVELQQMRKVRKIC